MPNKYNPEIHHRRSIRLKDYDYSQAGAYYVTICIQGKVCLLGDIAESVVALNDAGKMIEKWWCKLPKKFELIELDEYVIVPNHFHGIVNIVGATLVVARDNAIVRNNRAGTSPAPTLGEIIGSFKSICVYKCKNNGLNIGKLWQRNYYEHVIRNEDELNKIREYIVLNPTMWDEDDENPYKK
jgi:putative transposase